MTKDKNVPDWAIEDALKEHLTAHPTASWTPEQIRLEGNNSNSAGHGLALTILRLARYIAEHEEEPVDPLLIEAREIVAAWYEARPGKGGLHDTIRSGMRDGTPEVEQALAALRRGIELAQEAKHDEG